MLNRTTIIIVDLATVEIYFEIGREYTVYDKGVCTSSIDLFGFMSGMQDDSSESGLVQNSSTSSCCDATAALPAVGRPVVTSSRPGQTGNTQPRIFVINTIKSAGGENIQRPMALDTQAVSAPPNTSSYLTTGQSFTLSVRRTPFAGQENSTAAAQSQAGGVRTKPVLTLQLKGASGGSPTIPTPGAVDNNSGISRIETYPNMHSTQHNYSMAIDEGGSDSSPQNVLPGEISKFTLLPER